MNEKEILEKIHKEPSLRTLEINREMMDEEEMIMEFAASSEYPVRRWYGYEILDHKKSSIRMDRLKNGAAVRDNHIGDQIGIVEKAWVDSESKKIRVQVRYSKNSPRAKEIFLDLKDGIRKNVSMAYDVHKLELEKEDKDANVSYYRMVDWEPIHVAHVPDGADPSVGIGRNNPTDDKIKQLVDDEIQKRINELNLNTKIRTTTMTEKTPEQLAALAAEAAEAEKKAAIKLNEENRLKEEQRIVAIDALAKDYKDRVKGVNLEDHANLYKRTGKTAEAFGNFIVEKIEKESQTAIAQGHVDITLKNLKDYDIARAFRSAKDGSKCFERELSEQAAKQLGMNARGIVIPENVLALKKLSMMSARELKEFGLTLRDLTVGGALTGAELVGLTHMVSEYVGVMYNRTLAFKLGVRRLSGQVGGLSIPKMTAGSTFGWAATETGNFSESTPATAELNLTPKRGGTYVEVSTQALVQMQPSVAALVMDDLMMAVELGIDLAYFHGTGASGQPTGLALTSGIGSFGGPGIDWEKVVDAETDIETANADVGTMAFVTTPAVKAALKTRPILANISGPIWQPDNTVNGYGGFISNQITAGYAFFGVFSQSVIPMWGATELVVDDKSQRIAGLVRFLVETFIDVGIKIPGSYTLSTGTN